MKRPQNLPQRLPVVVQCYYQAYSIQQVYAAENLMAMK